MTRTPKKRIPAENSPLLTTPTGRLTAAFATMAHGYSNPEVISATLQFASSLLVTQIVPKHRAVMVDKFCLDLTQLVADKAAGSAAHPRKVAKRQAKAKKARPVRDKKAART
jgi:hypothetical protein